MKEHKRDLKRIIIYIVMAYIISGIGYYIWFCISPLGGFVTILAPIVSAYTICYLSHGEVKIHWKISSAADILIGAALPIGYIVISVAIYYILGYPFKQYQLTAQFLIPLVLQWILGGICEEAGWRGVLFPLLKKVMSFPCAVAVNAVIWFGWHVPLILTRSMCTAFTLQGALLFFFIEILCDTVIICNLTKTKYGKSVFTFATMHAVHNILMQIVVQFIPQTQLKILDEGGYILDITLFVVSVLFCLLYVKKQSKSKQSSLS